MDKFFTQTTCDRCGGSLKDGRIMSMFDESCICMNCKEKEKERSDYRIAADIDNAEIQKGNYNFHGIGYTSEE